MKGNRQEKVNIKNKTTNDNTNIILQNSETKKYNPELDEDKKSKEIIIKTNNRFNDECSEIVAKLPDPYEITDIIGNKKLISYQLKAKYKSKFADYFEKKNFGGSVDNKIIRNNKTSKYSLKGDKKFDKYINFTNFKMKYRALSNNIKLKQNLRKNELE